MIGQIVSYGDASELTSECFGKLGMKLAIQYVKWKIVNQIDVEIAVVSSW